MITYIYIYAILFAHSSMSIQRIQQTRTTPMTDFPLANPMCSGGLCDKTRWTLDMGWHGIPWDDGLSAKAISRDPPKRHLCASPVWPPRHGWKWRSIASEMEPLCKPMILYDFIITWIIKFRTYVSFYLLFYGSKGGEIEHPSLRKRWEWRSKPCR